MMDGSLEWRIHGTPGFCPSYLSTLESSPEARALVWNESERVLTAP